MAATPQSPDNLGQMRYLIGTNVETGIVATASGTQATAYQLQAQISRVDTCASSLDSVALPKITQLQSNDARPGMVGQLVFVTNNGAKPCQIYGVTPDTINGVATATGVLIPNGATFIAWADSYNQTTNVGTWQAILQRGGGELLTATLAVGAPISESNATPVDVLTLAVTPGTWDVSATIDRVLTGTTATIYGGGIGVTANTLLTQAGGSGIGTDPNVTMSATFGTTVTGAFSTVIGPVQCVFTADTTLHLIGADTFSAGTIGLYGTMRARRIK